MGAKTSVAVATDGDARALLGAAPSGPAAAAELVAEWLPGHTWLPGEPTTMRAGVYPLAGVAALRLPGIDVVAADEVLLWVEAPLPAHLAAAVGDRRLVVHAMHSVSDSLVYCVWQSGERVRALGMDLDAGVVLDVGAPTPVEEAFWRGDHDDGEGGALPFHPLDLGEELLRAELGFVLEGEPGQDDLDADEITMHTFRSRRTPAAATAAPPRRRGLFRRRG